MYTENRARSVSVTMRMCSLSDRAFSKLNFLFHLISKTNLVTLRKCNLHLQYYRIDSSFSIRLDKINLNVCDEYKTERETRRSSRAPWARSNLRAKRPWCDENVSAKRAVFLSTIWLNQIDILVDLTKFFSIC